DGSSVSGRYPPRASPGAGGLAAVCPTSRRESTAGGRADGTGAGRLARPPGCARGAGKRADARRCAGFARVRGLARRPREGVKGIPVPAWRLRALEWPPRSAARVWPTGGRRARGLARAPGWGADCATAPYANVRPLRTRKHGRPGAGPGAPGGGARHRPRPGRTADCSGETMSRLLELMRKLGSDAALAAEYEKNPEAVLQRAGLSAEERKAMLEKDYEAIKRLTGLADGKFATNH